MAGQAKLCTSVYGGLCRLITIFVCHCRCFGDVVDVVVVVIVVVVVFVVVVGVVVVLTLTKHYLL